MRLISPDWNSNRKRWSNKEPLWIQKDPHMFFSGFFMLLFTMLGIFLGKDPGGDKSQSLMFYISMYGEALMVYFLYRFVKQEEELEK